MHYSPVRGLKASYGNIMHLGEVQLGKNDPLWLHPGASRGALTILGSPKGRFLTGPWAMYRAWAQYDTLQIMYGIWGKL